MNISVYLSDEDDKNLIERMQAECTREDRSQSWVMRKALEEYLAHRQPQEKTKTGEESSQ